MDVYNAKDALERNGLYEVQQWVPGYWLIGQDGDLGYFIRVAPNQMGDVVYGRDLGALGSAEMTPFSPSIASLTQGAKVYTER